MDRGGGTDRGGEDAVLAAGDMAGLDGGMVLGDS